MAAQQQRRGVKRLYTDLLYTPQLDHLSNDAENFGGMMTEVNICTSVDPDTKVGQGCAST